MMLSETNTYKYLGVIINRRLSDSDHVKQHLAEKVKKLESYLRYTLANHMNIERVKFGNTLWHKALLPSIAHAAGVWFNDTESARKNLNSFQYKCAKAVMQLKCMPARAAILSELGWTPIIDHLDILRTAYYKHLLNMDESRLSKVVFNEMSKMHNKHTNQKTAFDYHKNLQIIFQERGMDHMFTVDGDIDITKFKVAVNESYTSTLLKDIENSSSLLLLKTLKDNVQCSGYLETSNGTFKAKQLKFKLRTGVLGLGADLVRQHRGQGTCTACGQFENAKHFILQCPSYNDLRRDMFNSIKQETETQMFDCFIREMDFALSAVLGSHDDCFNKHFMTYIQHAWKKRSEN